MKNTRPPLPKDTEEFIHRDSWDLDSLVGQTEAEEFKITWSKPTYKLSSNLFD